MFSINQEDKSVRWFPSDGTASENEATFNTENELRTLGGGWSKQVITEAVNSFAGSPGFDDVKRLKCVKSTGEGLKRLFTLAQRLDPSYVAPAPVNGAGPHLEVTAAADAHDGENCEICGESPCKCEISEADYENGEPGADGSLPDVDAQTSPADGPVIENDQERPVRAKRTPRKSPKAKAEKPASKRKVAKVKKPKAVAKKQPKAPRKAKKGSSAGRGVKKQRLEGGALAAIAKLIQRKSGATVSEIMEAMGFTQPHTVRGRVSNLRSSGMKIESVKDDKRGLVYKAA